MSFQYKPIPAVTSLPKPCQPLAKTYEAAAATVAKHQSEVDFTRQGDAIAAAEEADRQLMGDAIINGDDADILALGTPNLSALVARRRAHEQALEVATAQAFEAERALAISLGEHRDAVIAIASKAMPADSLASIVETYLDAREKFGQGLDFLSWSYTIDGREVPNGYGSANHSPDLDWQHVHVGGSQFAQAIRADALRAERAEAVEAARQAHAAANARAEEVNRSQLG